MIDKSISTAFAASRINGFQHASRWLTVLQQATGRSDLGFLTTGAWDHLFPTRHFQKDRSAWCALCLREDHEPYDRLQWTLEPNNACSEHRIPLQRHCARCGRSLPVLHERSAPRRCPYCGGDLREIHSETNCGASSEFDLWTSKELGRVIARSSEWSQPLSWNPQVVFRRICTMAGIRSIAEFGAAIGTSKVTAWYWLTGRARPSLRFTLHICYRFGVSLAALLTQPERVRPEHDPRQSEFYLPRTRKAAKRDWKKIEKEILAHVRRPQRKAVALAQVARELDVAARTLRVHFPALCRKIGHRYRRRMRAEAAARQRKLEREIRGAIEKLTAAGSPVKPQSIAACLGRAGLFGRHNARSALQQVIADARIDNPVPLLRVSDRRDNFPLSPSTTSVP